MIGKFHDKKGQERHFEGSMARLTVIYCFSDIYDRFFGVFFSIYYHVHEMICTKETATLILVLEAKLGHIQKANPRPIEASDQSIIDICF